MKNKGEELVRDPVCGMWIYPDDAADIELYKEKIYYFCAPACKKKFNEDPEKCIAIKSNGNKDSGEIDANEQ